MSEQKKLRNKVAVLISNKRAIAERVTSLRAEVVAEKRKVEERYQDEISLSVGAWELLDQEMRSLQGACLNKFHADIARAGRCPDCDLFKSSSS